MRGVPDQRRDGVECREETLARLEVFEPEAQLEERVVLELAEAIMPVAMERVETEVDPGELRKLAEQRATV